MAQFASPGWLRSPAAVLTVSDLLSRNAPVPVEILGDQTTPPLSVGSLLRREGRAPHALDRPVRPRASRADARGDTTLVRPIVSGVVVKRGAIAAGALLAAGSVFGVTVLTDASPVGDQESLAGPYAGQGGLDRTVSTGSTPAVVISPTANTGGLDAGATAPSSWVPVAFPGAPPAAQKSPAARIPTTPVTGGSSSSPATGDNAGPGRSSAGSSHGVGGTVSGAAGSAVDQAGTTASDTGKGLGPTVDTVTQPVTSLLEPATVPVTSLVGGLVNGPLV